MPWIDIKKELLTEGAESILEEEKVEMDDLVKKEDTENTNDEEDKVSKTDVEVGKVSKTFKKSLHSVHKKITVACYLCRQMFTSK
jgi:hypothetical protein